MKEGKDEWIILSYKEIKEKLGIKGKIIATEPMIVGHNEDFEDTMGIKFYLQSEEKENGKSDL